MITEMGRTAYEAYGDSVEWLTFSGARMPSWADQNERLKLAWSAAAEAVIKKMDEK